MLLDVETPTCVRVIFDFVTMHKADPAEVCVGFAEDARYVVAAIILFDWRLAHWTWFCECHNPCNVF